MSKLTFLSFQNPSLPRKTTPKQISRRRSGSGGSGDVPRVFKPKMEEVRWVFDKFDTNKDGKISWEEYKSAMKALGNGNGSVEGVVEMLKAFQVLDSDGDGFVDFKEFLEMQNVGGGVKSSEIESAFKVFDLDGNGKISAEELLQVLRRMGEKCSLESCRKMVRGVDADGDGLIDMEEFMTMMTRTTKLSAP